mmetsp:Transcript_43058/g.69981  ORF Transcript_43058/g.69981 Transcript_43058/m.69981 type:complete len:181 (-) Transcript_43058:95-637(-)
MQLHPIVARTRCVLVHQHRKNCRHSINSRLLPVVFAMTIVNSAPPRRMLSIRECIKVRSGHHTNGDEAQIPWDKDTPLLVVVSRYGEDVDWINGVKHPCIVYEKETESARFNTPKNKAKEASSYLQFLSDHYHNLPQHVAFTHGSSTSWHHRGYLRNKLNMASLPMTESYRSLNRNRLNR